MELPAQGKVQDAPVSQRYPKRVLTNVIRHPWPWDSYPEPMPIVFGCPTVCPLSKGWRPGYAERPPVWWR